MRRLVVSCDLKQLFLCSALKMDSCSFPLHLASIYVASLYSSVGQRPTSYWREEENHVNLALNHCSK